MSGRTAVGVACQLIGEWTGFELRESAPRRIKEFLERRATMLGYSSLALYLEDLRTADEREPEPQRLINLVTNGLTAFWRDAAQLEAMRAAITEGFEGLDRPVRIWCAGCSTGEEAYTVAMIADEEDVSVEVVGTDINTDFLQHAAVGLYAGWSLRRLDDRRKEKFFLEIEGQWAVRNDLLSTVEFQRHNLLKEPPHGPWDIILCRNVLIYHSPDAVQRITENFATALTQDGFLLMGSSEQLQDEWNLFRPSQHGGGFLYRHANRTPGSTMPVPVLTDEFVAPPELAPISTLEEETIDIEDDEAVIRLLRSGISHQRAGHRESALACYEAAAGYDPFVPDTYCLMAVALEASGASAKAAESFQKALFVNPYHWFAAFKLGQLQDAHGEQRRAAQAYRQALEGMQTNQKIFDGRLQFPEFDRIEKHRNEVAEACRARLEI